MSPAETLKVFSHSYSFFFYVLFIYLLIYLFIYFEIEKDSRSWGGAEREGDTESEAGSTF